ncbi:MAG: galactosyltransferase-related protein, partial [Planctomycetota bacterium]
LFEEINGFDERFVGWGLEDSDVRDRVMRLRPRPRVKILHGVCDAYHLWHPILPGKRMANRAYYDSPRPIRCEQGLVRGAAAP